MDTFQLKSVGFPYKQVHYFTTRCARGTEDTEADYSFPLPVDDGKGKTTADSLCAPCLCGEDIFETAPDHV